MRLESSTWPPVSFLLQVQLSAFCLPWQQHYRSSGNPILQAEDRLTWESWRLLPAYLQVSNCNWKLSLAQFLPIRYVQLSPSTGEKAEVQHGTERNPECKQDSSPLKQLPLSSWPCTGCTAPLSSAPHSRFCSWEGRARGEVKVDGKKEYASDP